MDYNCQEQSMIKYLLVILENQRLNKKLENRDNQEVYQDRFVRDRIRYIEESMGLEMKLKEQRIKELQCYMKQLKSQNKQIHQEYQNLTNKYQNLQREHENLTKIPKQNVNEKQMKNYQMNIILKQKQELIEQIENLKMNNIKQLQTDIVILKRENQNYIVSINNYRIQNQNYKNQKINLQKENKRFEQENKMLKNNCQIYKNIVKQKQELEKQIELIQQQNKKEFQKIKDDYIKKLNQYKQKKEFANLEFEKIKIAFVESQQSLERKSKKLKQYDEQYDFYLTKMNNLTIQNSESKQETKKVKQHYENLLTQQKQKLLSLTKQQETRIKKLKQDFGNQMQKTILQIQQKSNKQKQRLSNQINKMTKQIETKQIEHKQIENKLLQEKNQIVMQWEELLVEMKKQKEIIAELEKNISSSLKNNISYTFSMKQLKGSLLEINNQENQKKYEQPTEKLQQHKQNVPQLLKENTKGQSKANLCCEQCVYKKSMNQKRVHQFCSKQQYLSLQNLNNDKTKLNQNKFQKTQYNNFESKQLKQSTEIFTNVSLSSKRKDDGFRKYDYIKNRIQESQQKIQTGYNQNLQFFQRGLKSNTSYSLQKSQKQWDSCQLQKNNYNYRSSQKQRMSTQIMQSQGKQRPQRLMKSSSLRKVDYDSSLKQIQQYLSFDLRAMEKPISRTSSDSKFQPPSSERSLSFRTQDENADHSMLIEKLNKINSCRDQSKNKSYNFMKRPNVQPPNRTILLDKRNQKQNINAIITRKCMLIGQK